MFLKIEVSDTISHLDKEVKRLEVRWDFPAMVTPPRGRGTFPRIPKRQDESHKALDVRVPQEEWKDGT